MIYKNQYNSPLGKIILHSDGESLLGVWFENQKYFPSNSTPTIDKDLPIFDDAKKWFDTYFSREIPTFTPKLNMENLSPFRKQVLEILQNIPYGTTTTYGEIAKKIGVTQMSPQAVGGAVSHNPFAIIIPCHRVVGVGGSLTGYAGGMDRKIQLLELEKGN